MADTQNFNELVEKAKFLLRMNQAELAQEIGISPQYMSDIVKGRKPKAENKYAEMIRKLCAGIENPPQNMTAMNPFFTDFTIQGGTGHGFDAIIEEKKVEPEGYMTVPGIKNDPDISFFQVDGKSMEDPNDPYNSIPQGSWVAIRKPNTNDVFWGHIYAFMTLDGPVVKKVMPSDKGDDYIKIVSLNSNQFPPRELHRSEIIGDMMLVVGCVNVRKF